MFAPHLATIFAALGRTAVYTAPDADPLTLRVIRCGGGEPVKYGSVAIMLERVRFEVLRSALISPVPGASLVADGASWIIQAAQPVENDAYGLKWSLDAAWGADLIWRSISGSGSSQNPPSISGPVTLAADAVSGAATVSLRADYAVGRLLAGDTVSIGGITYSVTSPAKASSGGFAAIGIDPVLTVDAAIGDAVEIAFARDVTITAAISGYQASELQGGVQVGDLRIVLLASAVTNLLESPKVGDMVILGGVGLRVANINPVYAGGKAIGWEVTARK